VRGGETDRGMRRPGVGMQGTETTLPALSLANFLAYLHHCPHDPLGYRLPQQNSFGPNSGVIAYEPEWGGDREIPS